MTKQPVIETITSVTDRKLMQDIFGNMNSSDVSNLMFMLELTDDTTRDRWYEMMKIVF